MFTNNRYINKIIFVYDLTFIVIIIMVLLMIADFSESIDELSKAANDIINGKDEIKINLPNSRGLA